MAADSVPGPQRRLLGGGGLFFAPVTPAAPAPPDSSSALLAAGGASTVADRALAPSGLQSPFAVAVPTEEPRARPYLVDTFVPVEITWAEDDAEVDAQPSSTAAAVGAAAATLTTHGGALPGAGSDEDDETYQEMLNAVLQLSLSDVGTGPAPAAPVAGPRRLVPGAPAASAAGPVAAPRAAVAAAAPMPPQPMRTPSAPAVATAVPTQPTRPTPATAPAPAPAPAAAAAAAATTAPRRSRANPPVPATTPPTPFVAKLYHAAARRGTFIAEDLRRETSADESPRDAARRELFATCLRLAQANAAKMSPAQFMELHTIVNDDAIWRTRASAASTADRTALEKLVAAFHAGPGVPARLAINEASWLEDTWHALLQLFRKGRLSPWIEQLIGALAVLGDPAITDCSPRWYTGRILDQAEAAVEEIELFTGIFHEWYDDDMEMRRTALQLPAPPPATRPAAAATQPARAARSTAVAADPTPAARATAQPARAARPTAAAADPTPAARATAQPARAAIPTAVAAQPVAAVRPTAAVPATVTTARPAARQTATAAPAPPVASTRPATRHAAAVAHAPSIDDAASLEYAMRLQQEEVDAFSRFQEDRQLARQLGQPSEDTTRRYAPLRQRAPVAAAPAPTTSADDEELAIRLYQEELLKHEQAEADRALAQRLAQERY